MTRECQEEASPQLSKDQCKENGGAGCPPTCIKKFETLEGENYPRTVIWEFPSHEQAMKCHDSKEYQDGWALAKDTTDRNLQIVEGFSTE